MSYQQQSQPQQQQRRVVVVSMYEDHFRLLSKLLQQRNAAHIRKTVVNRGKSGRSDPIPIDNYYDIETVTDENGVATHHIAPLNPNNPRYNETTPRVSAASNYDGSYLSNVSSSIAANFQQLQVSSPQYQQQQPIQLLPQVVQQFQAQSQQQVQQQQPILSPFGNPPAQGVVQSPFSS